METAAEIKMRTNRAKKQLFDEYLFSVCSLLLKVHFVFEDLTIWKLYVVLV